MHLSRILVLDNGARTLSVGFLLGSEAETLIASGSFSLFHCTAARGGVADAWCGRCEGAWVVPVCLLHWVQVWSALEVLAWAWAYEALRGVPLGSSGGGVAVLGGRAKWGSCAVYICGSCYAGGRTRRQEGAVTVLTHAATMVGVRGDLIFLAKVDLGESSAP